MNELYLLIGGNTGDKWQYLQQATQAIIDTIGPIQAYSPVYKSAAWGNVAEGYFLNQALLVHTSLAPDQCLAQALRIEESLGRHRTEKWGNRTIDIDILLYNNSIVNTHNLQIPHPYLHQRAFVLTPLANFAGQVVHPILLQSINKLCQQCSDPLSVEIYTQ
jgi:2-amino-4-hydroxy-6-hydroxymethyldihydropteridine diphosphokinase